MAAGGLSAISRHSAARSTTSTTSRISVVSRAAPEMRDFSTSLGNIEQAGELETSANPAKLTNLGGQLMLGLNPAAIDATGQGEQFVPARAAKRHIPGSDRAGIRIPARGRWCEREEIALIHVTRSGGLATVAEGAFISVRLKKNASSCWLLAVQRLRILPEASS